MKRGRWRYKERVEKRGGGEKGGGEKIGEIEMRRRRRDGLERLRATICQSRPECEILSDDDAISLLNVRVKKKKNRRTRKK